MTNEALKQQLVQAIDARRDDLGQLCEQIRRTAELGFREHETSALVRRTYDGLNLDYSDGLAVTGVRATLKGGSGNGPTVAILGELDALPIPNHPQANPATGAAHACGHDAQTAMVLAVAMALKDTRVLEHLSGGVALFHVPAEELVDIGYRMSLRAEGNIQYLVGKPELIRLGHFDDVSMALMVHNTGVPANLRLGIGSTLNGCVMKDITFYGRGAHAGAGPHLGINALNAAQIAFTAIHAQRETFRDEDAVRVHWIITSGGTAINVVPSSVKVEMFVRARSAEALAEADQKVDRALRAGAMAIGAKVGIHTLPGYMPILPYPHLDEVFAENAEYLVGRDGLQKMGHKGGSTDLGDLSYIMPAIHPFTGGAKGTAHGADWDVGDLDSAVLTPAKAMAMTLVDLLSDGARRALDVLERSKPPMTRQRYLDFLKSLDREETYP